MNYDKIGVMMRCMRTNILNDMNFMSLCMSRSVKNVDSNDIEHSKVHKIRARDLDERNYQLCAKKHVTERLNRNMEYFE